MDGATAANSDLRNWKDAMASDTFLGGAPVGRGLVIYVGEPTHNKRDYLDSQ